MPGSAKSLLGILLLAVGMGVVHPAAADDSADRPKKSAARAEKSASKPAAPPVKITPQREAAALAFAQENHPELAALLDGLKRNAPREYQAALVDLDRAVERLAKVEERSPERYRGELADWTMTSRIRLLAARLTMSPDPAVEAELRAALQERLQHRLAAQRTERARLQTRVTKLDQQIEEIESRSDAIVEKQFQELRKTLPAPRPAAKSKTKKPASHRASTSK